MSYGIKQIRFYNKNNIVNTSYEKLTSNCLEGHNVVKLGIQGPPGLTFWVNSEHEANPTQPAIIGLTGVYELDLSDLTYISSLQFTTTGLNLIDQNNNLSLIIDFIYEETEGKEI